MGLGMEVLGAHSPGSNPGPLLTSPEKALKLSVLRASCTETGLLGGF